MAAIGSLVWSRKRVHLIRLDGRHLVTEQQLMWAIQRIVLLVDEHLVELLPRPQARVDDGGWRSGVDLGGETMGQVDDLHGLTHVEHEDIAILTNCAGLEHQLDRLRDGHEVAGHLGVGDRDGLAASDLVAERRDDRSIRAQDVAEAHRHVDTAGLRAEVGREPLADSLRQTEHVDGVGSLVGRHVHESLDPGFGGGSEYVLHTKHVGLHALRGMAFQEGDVLVGGCVEHHVWLVLAEDGSERVEIADVGEHQLGVLQQRPAIEPQLQGVEAVLGVIQHQQTSGAVLADRLAQLRSDRAAGPGDEHGLATEVGADLVVVELDLVAAEEVGQRQLTDVAERNRLSEELVHRRKDPHRQPLALGRVGNLQDGLPIRRRHGDEQPTGLVLGSGLCDRGAITRHGQTRHPKPGSGRIVVEKRHGQQVARRILTNGLHGLMTRIASTEHQDAIGPRVCGATAVLFDDTQHETNGEGAEHVIRTGRQQRTPGHDVVARRRNQSEEQDDLGDQGGGADPADLFEAGNTPAPDVETREEPGDEVDDDGEHDSDTEPCNIHLIRRELEPCVRGRRQCDQPQHRIDTTDESVAVAERKSSERPLEALVVGSRVGHS